MDGKESQCPIVVLKRGNGPPGPRGAKGVPRCGRGVEPRRGHRASPACHRETTPSCGGQRFHSVTNRVHLTCTPGSVGDLGGRPPRSTRPLLTVLIPTPVMLSCYRLLTPSSGSFLIFTSVSRWVCSRCGVRPI